MSLDDTDRCGKFLRYVCKEMTDKLSSAISSAELLS